MSSQDPADKLASLSLGGPSTPPSGNGLSDLDRTPRSIVRPEGGSASSLESASGLEDVERLSNEVARLFSLVYEIEELRHTTSSADNRNVALQLDTLLSTLSERVTSLQPRVDGAVHTTQPISGQNSSDVAREITLLAEDWNRFRRLHAVLQDEMKEDGWLVRFRTTADQAEAMMDPLQASLSQCTAYLEQLTQVPEGAPYASEDDDQPNYRRFMTLVKTYQSMQKTYVPSVTKIIKMIDRSVSERSAKNGEALRRLEDLKYRWATLSRQLQQFDLKISQISSRYPQADSPAHGHMETLISAPSPISPTGGYVGLPPESHYDKETKSIPSHRGSTSSGLSSSSHSRQSHGSLQPKVSQATLTSDHDHSRKLRRQSSFTSQGASIYAEKPRWNISTRPPPVPPLPDYHHTQIHSRNTSFASRIRVPSSPSPSSASRVSVPSRNVSGSRVLTLSPEPRVRSPPPVRPTALGESTNDLALRTPSRPRPSLPNAPHTFAGGPSMPSATPRSLSYGTTPRTAPARQNLLRSPPSAFSSTTPTPSRPTSRMSMTSFAAASAELLPFQPSKYDVLDGEVERILKESGYMGFVARLDPALKRGQRRREGEEWKGEFVFGAGERSSSVKLLSIAGRGVDSAKQRVKCLVKVAGAWHDLGAFLSGKVARQHQESGMSPSP